MVETQIPHTISRRAWHRWVLAGGAGLAGLSKVQAQTAPACPALLSRSFARLQDEKPVSLCRYAGRVLLVVNTASLCGFTPQYRALESLHAQFSAEGLTVLGFPANDFGNQEPGTAEQIADLCENTFGVRFPLFAKSTVVESAGARRNPLFADLARMTGVSPRWNFHKYLVARDGLSAQSFDSRVDPSSGPFVAAVRKLLAAR